LGKPARRGIRTLDRFRFLGQTHGIFTILSVW
jgi:hypothetical protein